MPLFPAILCPFLFIRHIFSELARGDTDLFLEGVGKMKFRGEAEQVRYLGNGLSAIDEHILGFGYAKLKKKIMRSCIILLFELTVYIVFRAVEFFRNVVYRNTRGDGSI